MAALAVNIAGDLAYALGEGDEDLGCAALEALAAEAHSMDLLSLEQVRRLLGPESRCQAQDVLCRHGVWSGQSAMDILKDEENSAGFRAGRP